MGGPEYVLCRSFEVQDGHEFAFDSDQLVLGSHDGQDVLVCAWSLIDKLMDTTMIEPHAPHAFEEFPVRDRSPSICSRLSPTCTMRTREEGILAATTGDVEAGCSHRSWND